MYKIMERMLQDLNAVTVASMVASKALSDLLAMQNHKYTDEFVVETHKRSAAWSSALGAFVESMDKFGYDSEELVRHLYGER